jgi:hypothetical protein
VGMPEMVGSHEQKLFGVLIEEVNGVNTDLASNAAGINDNTGISRAEREKKLKALFRAHGFTLKFEGTAPKGPVKFRSAK